MKIFYVLLFVDGELFGEKRGLTERQAKKLFKYYKKRWFNKNKTKSNYCSHIRLVIGY